MNDPVQLEVRSRVVAVAQGHRPFALLLAGGTVVDIDTPRPLVTSRLVG